MTELPDGIIEAKRNAEEALFALPEVTGMVVGFAERAGAAADDIVIRVYVRPGSDAAASIPTSIEGFPVETAEAEFVPLTATSTTQAPAASGDVTADGGYYDPVIGGISIGPDRWYDFEKVGGTLGVVAIDTETYRPMLLSNYHVLAVRDGWRVGTDIVQPGAIDSSEGDVVGSLQRAELSQAVDAAVALQTDRDYAWKIADFGLVNGTATAQLGMAVAKRGRTTKATYGSISGLDASIRVNYEYGVGEKILLDQIEIRTDATRNQEFSAGGDSGSVIVDDTRAVVGLLFAGIGDTTETERTYANHIGEVTKRMKIGIPGSGEVPAMRNKRTLTNTSRHAPVLATAPGRPLVVAYTGTDGRINILESQDGTTFGAPVVLDQKASGEPAIVLAGTGNVDQADYIAWTGTNSRGNLNVARLGDGWKITDHQVIPQYSGVNPGLAMTDDGTLVLAWKGRGNTSLNLATTTDGGKTLSSKLITNQQSGLGPWLAQIETRLYLLWRGSSNTRPNIAQVTSLSPITLGYPTVLNDESCASHPSLASAGQLLLGWQGEDRNQRVNVGFARNGTDFKKVTFNESTVATPTLLRYREVTLIAWTGTDSRINLAELDVPA